jgi:hypothetical protein
MTTLVNTTLIIESPAFAHNTAIPHKFSCNGANINPAFEIRELPGNTKSLAFIMDDPDAPGGTYDHWIMWNIPPMERIEEDSAPGIQGMNSEKEMSYIGPCPPPGTPHHYHFKVFALDTTLDLDKNISKKYLVAAMEGHIIASGEIVGLFKR